VYVLPSGDRTYFVDYRDTAGARRRLTIGRRGKATAESAGKLAIAMLDETLNGEDPAKERATRRKSLTVKELCHHYLDAVENGAVPQFPFYARRVLRETPAGPALAPTVIRLQHARLRCKER